MTHTAWVKHSLQHCESWWWYYRIKSSMQVISHQEAAGYGYTSCPGRNFPLEETRAYIRNYGQTMEPTSPVVKQAQDGPPVYKVTVGTLNFREQPDGMILKQLHRGDMVKLDRYVPGENWSRVYHNGQLGWVWLNYIGA